MVNPANREAYNAWMDACEEARDMYDDWKNAETLQEFDRLYVEWIGYSQVTDEPSITLDEIRNFLFDYLLEFCQEYGIDSMGYVNPFDV